MTVFLYLFSYLHRNHQSSRCRRNHRRKTSARDPFPGRFSTIYILCLSSTITIPKPGRNDYSKVKNYRPIALLDVIGKWGAKLIARCLQDEAIRADLLHPLQMGGAKQRSTVDAGVFLTRHIAEKREPGLYTSSLAVDVS